MSDELKQLETLRANLKKAPAELDIAELFPIFVPTTFFALGNWPGPYETFAIPGLGLTWTVLQSDQIMRYVDHRVQNHWEAAGINWRAKAYENMRLQSAPMAWTHEFKREDGSLFAVAMMQADGCGPARLLLRASLRRAFPEGYLVALPEMSCGVVLSTRATAEERARIADLVDSCFQGGTRPLVPGIHEISLLVRIGPEQTHDE